MSERIISAGDGCKCKCCEYWVPEIVELEKKADQNRDLKIIKGLMLEVSDLMDKLEDKIYGGGE